MKCSDVAVDSRPRSSAADQALFGGEQSPRVRAASCGAIGTVCTQRAFNDICSFLTALRTQRRSNLVSSTRCSCTEMLLEEWLLKRLPLFLGCAFVLSLSRAASSLSWLGRACESTWPPAATQRSASTLWLPKRGAKDGRRVRGVRSPAGSGSLAQEAQQRDNLFGRKSDGSKAVTHCSTGDFLAAETPPGSGGAAAAAPTAGHGCWGSCSLLNIDWWPVASRPCQRSFPLMILFTGRLETGHTMGQPAGEPRPSRTTQRHPTADVGCVVSVGVLTAGPNG